MRVMMIAGESSGDLHGAGVVGELLRRDPSCEIIGIGGDRMQAAGMKLVYHVRELSVMGFWEVLRHLPLLRSVERTMAALVRASRPDAVVLIDYPGFNLRFARIARRSTGVRILYYISPQVWAWNRRRVRKMKGLIDKMLVVFPFEEELYRAEGIDVRFVGHPLLEEIDPEPQDRKGFCTRYGLDPGKQILGLFPGSRRQELERIFPAMLGAARMLYRDRGTQAVVGVAPNFDIEYVRDFLRDDFPVKLIQHATYDAMKNSDLALVTSGTATLETAFFRTPMIVVYRTSALTYLLGRLLIRIRNIGLVNIVAGTPIVPEILQGRVNASTLAGEAAKLLDDAGARSAMSGALAVVRERLGTPGASSRVAETILSIAGRVS